MKLSSWDKQLVLALPRECAASQSDQTINPSKNEVRNGGGAGCKSPLPHLTEGRGDAFLLDILFHRMSVIACLQQLSVNSKRRGGIFPAIATSCTPLGLPSEECSGEIGRDISDFWGLIVRHEH